MSRRTPAGPWLIRAATFVGGLGLVLAVGSVVDVPAAAAGSCPGGSNIVSSGSFSYVAPSSCTTTQQPYQFSGQQPSNSPLLQLPPVSPYASPTPDATSDTWPAIYNGSASQDQLAALYQRDYAYLQEVNAGSPRGTFDVNCLYCAIATDQAVAYHADVSAMPNDPSSYPDPNLSPYGVKWQDVSGRGFTPVKSYDQIAQEMEQAGQGARGLVYLIRTNGSAHIFNVVHDANGIVFLDSQTPNGFATLEPTSGLTSLEFLPTNYVPQPGSTIDTPTDAGPLPGAQAVSDQQNVGNQQENSGNQTQGDTTGQPG